MIGRLIGRLVAHSEGLPLSSRGWAHDWRHLCQFEAQIWSGDVDCGALSLCKFERLDSSLRANEAQVQGRM